MSRTVLMNSDDPGSNADAAACKSLSIAPIHGSMGHGKRKRVSHEFQYVEKRGSLLACLTTIVKCRCEKMRKMKKKRDEDAMEISIQSPFIQMNSFARRRNCLSRVGG